MPGACGLEPALRLRLLVRTHAGLLAPAASMRSAAAGLDPPPLAYLVQPVLPTGPTSAPVRPHPRPACAPRSSPARSRRAPPCRPSGGCPSSSAPSRHAVREALKRLQEAGLIRISHGGATRVRDWRHDGGLDLLLALAAQGDAPPELELERAALELRACIGADAARRCAERASAAAAGRDRRARGGARRRAPTPTRATPSTSGFGTSSSTPPATSPTGSRSTRWWPASTCSCSTPSASRAELADAAAIRALAARDRRRASRRARARIAAELLERSIA